MTGAMTGEEGKLWTKRLYTLNLRAMRPRNGPTLAIQGDDK
jgi:hypothetical protein